MPLANFGVGNDEAYGQRRLFRINRTIAAFVMRIVVNILTQEGLSTRVAGILFC